MAFAGTLRHASNGDGPSGRTAAIRIEVRVAKLYAPERSQPGRRAANAPER
jgi:hypothetical protein